MVEYAAKSESITTSLNALGLHPSLQWRAIIYLEIIELPDFKQVSFTAVSYDAAAQHRSMIYYSSEYSSPDSEVHRTSPYLYIGSVKTFGSVSHPRPSTHDSPSRYFRATLS